MFTFAAIRAFFSGKINIIFLVLLASLGTVIGVQYLDGKAKNSEISSLNTKIESLNLSIGSKDNTIAQQKSDLQQCSDATQQMKDAADKQKAQAAQELAIANKKAQDNLNYAKNILKASPIGATDYDAAKNLMNQLIDRRSAK